ncbi:cell division protein ZipA, partial [Providencia stuartii]
PDLPPITSSTRDTEPVLNITPERSEPVESDIDSRVNAVNEQPQNQSSENNKETVLVLHVAALQGQVLQGEALLQSILQAGF